MGLYALYNGVYSLTNTTFAKLQCKYNVNDLGLAMGLIFWYDIVLSMYAGGLLGLVAVIVYRMFRKVIHIIYKKRHLQNTDDQQKNIL